KTGDKNNRQQQATTASDNTKATCEGRLCFVAVALSPVFVACLCRLPLSPAFVACLCRLFSSQVVAHRIANKIGIRFHAELFEYACAVTADRLGIDAEPRGDFLETQPARDHRQHFELARREIEMRR